MRIDHLRTAIGQLALKGALATYFHSQYIDGNWIYSIKELPEFRELLEETMKVPVVSSIAEQIFISQPLRLVYDTVRVDQSLFKQLLELAQKVDIYVNAMRETLEFLSRGNEADISIKLPPISHFSDVVAKLERLEKVLAQALSILADPPVIKVAKWEKGSLWIDLLVGSASGVMLIGGVTWAAACAYKKYQEGRIIQKASESMGIKNDILSSLKDGVTSAIETLIEAESKRLDMKHSKGKGDPESIQRLQFCIRETFEMIKDGTEIHPALMAPEDVKNVFPDMTQILALPSTQKLLKDHAEAEASELSS